MAAVKKTITISDPITLSYFENLAESNGKATIREITDKSQTTVVQHIVKVSANKASYTINIYNTTSRLLINGNGANQFLDNDLKNIHSIVLKSLKEQGVEGLSTEQLNRQLGNQLQSLLHKDNNSTIRTGTNKKQEVEEGNDTCTKCNQRCKTRSTYCDKGSHWVHYKCQKLSELEIQMAENSNGDEYYECKLCIAAKSNILALEGSTQSHTNAQLLLTEETEAKRGYNTDETLDTSPEEQNCTVCDNILMDPEWDICEQCNSKCHFKCMTEISTAYISSLLCKNLVYKVLIILHQAVKTDSDRSF
ncbi:unnamed protein product [Mytilus edulis]|uniref:Uncharacterized protein n=1 Tax=Mytilus edulis TaxID=6550 RepID=A0A8S3QRR0_MYTED|nr:unnamed protein product [Mytilus edulis]